MKTNNGSRPRRLSPRQVTAAELAAAGMGDREIAVRVGVSRQTVNRWRNQNGTFMGMLEERQQVMRDLQMARLGGLLDLAMDVIEGELRGKDAAGRRQTALAVLRASGLQGYAQPPKTPSREEAERDSVFDVLAEIAEDMGFRVG